MKNIFFLSSILLFTQTIITSAATGITPYKHTGSQKKPAYTIPAASRFTLPRPIPPAPAIVYYFSKPPTYLSANSYPIAIVCGGSSNQESLKNNPSIVHFHRSLLQDFWDVGAAVLTVEQWGIDGNSVDADLFMDHYTRSQRLSDHQMVIEHIKQNPPAGWNGTFIFFGASEGGPLMASLTQQYAENTVAAISWVSADGWSWHDELWLYVCESRKTFSWFLKFWNLMPRWMPYSPDLPKTKKAYDRRMKEIVNNPTSKKEFMGMTYLYHTDACAYPPVNYHKLTVPFLAVVGAQDPAIASFDCFVKKARQAGVPIDYIRVEDMDHNIRSRPDIIAQSFAWLKQKLLC